jgi:signal transduction histidine kinase
MQNSGVQQLRDFSESVDRDPNPEKRAEALAQAFRLFSEETARLEAAYKDLQKRFLELNNQLEERTQQLQSKVEELSTWQQIANRNDRLKELGEMAASLAHEIRNPLGGIKGFAALLKRDLSQKPELQQMADYIVQGSLSIDRLITNTLNYARPLHLEKELVEIAPFLEEICSFAKADTAVGERVLLTQKASKGASASFDRQLIRNVLLNLIHNSAEASEKGKGVHIEASVKGEQLHIKVKDHGAGIAPEHLEKIFSPFFTTKTEGNGLGLAEAHKIVSAHNGWIEFQSTLSSGTTATLTLPLK